jgi:hypothetical protein
MSIGRFRGGLIAVQRDGIALFECRHDLEGIVAKRKDGAYSPGAEPDWLKIRNCNYSQWVGREALFERERESNPDARPWNECVRACEMASAEFL